MELTKKNMMQATRDEAALWLGSDEESGPGHLTIRKIVRIMGRAKKLNVPLPRLRKLGIPRALAVLRAGPDNVEEILQRAERGEGIRVLNEAVRMAATGTPSYRTNRFTVDGLRDDDIDFVRAAMSAAQNNLPPFSTQAQCIRYMAECFLRRTDDAKGTEC